MNTSIEAIRSAIATSVAQSYDIRRQINATSGKERDSNWRAKRSHGTDTRYLLLALAYLRGMPYSRVERPRKGNEPSAHWVATVMVVGGAGASDAVIREEKGRIEAWIEAEPTPVLTASESAVAA